MFRTPEEEVKELTKELRELKDVLRDVSSKVAQIETRVKRTFPTLFPKTPTESRRPASKLTDPPTISAQEVLKLYDDLVAMAKQGDRNEVQRRLETMCLPDLAFLSRELGVSSGKSKPSRKALLKGVLGRINESMMLSTSSLRQRAAYTEGSDDKERSAGEQTDKPNLPENSGSSIKDNAG